MTWTTLHDACERQDTEAILVRCKTHPQEAVMADEKGSTPLHIACWRNLPLPVIQALIEAFPQAVSHQDVHGDTPLHVALTNPETCAQVVRALIQACPTVVSIANKEGLQPLHEACRHCAHEQVIDVLLEQYPYALRAPIKRGELVSKRKNSLGPKETDHVILDGTRQLKGSMTDMRFQAAEQQVRDGGYPLHMAIASGANKTVVEMLMKEAPDVLRMTNKYGQTPLHVAMTVDADTEIVELLLHTKEDLEALTIADTVHGNLPLHVAAIHGCRDAVAVLLLTEHSGAVRVKNNDGKTPLDLAREYNNCSPEFLGLLERESKSPRNVLNMSTLQWPDDA